MDATKNKKFLPVIITVAAVVLVGAVVLILTQLHLLGGGGAEVASTPKTVTALPARPAPAAPAVSIKETTPGAPMATKKIVAKPAKVAANPAKPKKKVLPTVAHPNGVPGGPAGTTTNAPVVAAGVTPTVPTTPLPPGTYPAVNAKTAPDPFGGAVTPGKKPKKRVVQLAEAPTGVMDQIRRHLLFHTTYVQPDFSSGNDTVGALPGTGGGFGAPPAQGGYNPGGGGGPQSPLPRVSGILYDNGVYAILQPANGEAQTVKPNDDVPGVGKVLSIQSDSVTLRTTDGRVVNLPLASSGG